MKRRRVVRAVLGWGILSFAVLQIYEPVMHGLHLPEWTLTLVVVVLGVGFPATFVLAWIFDMGPGGVERTPSAPEGAATPGRRVRTALLLVGLGVLFSVPGWAWYVWHERARPAVGGGPGRDAAPPDGGTSAMAASSGATTAPSIAVLPFADMSEKHDQEYFADGVAEEILNALAQVEGLRVPGRTSSFWFKGKNAKLAEIGRELNVTHVLEGSVRRAGKRLRVTAQVVNVADGGHLWSETFDRDQADVFAVQDQVAKAVVDALKLKLLPGARPPRTAARTTSLEAYEQYLLGRQLSAAGRPETMPAARDAFQRAVDLDPSFAAAYAGLSHAWGDMGGYLAQGPEDVVRFAKLQREAAERSLALAPDSSDGLVARADYRLGYAWDWPGALADTERVASMGGADWVAHTTGARALAALGRSAEAAVSARRATEVDPLARGAWSSLASILEAMGDYPGAERAARHALVLGPGSASPSFSLGLALFQQGRYEEALGEFDRNPFEWWRLEGRAIVQHKLGREPESRAALEALESGYAGISAFQIAETHAVRGENAAAFRWLERARIQHDGGLEAVRYDCLLAPLRADPRWKTFLRKMNLPVD